MLGQGGAADSNRPAAENKICQFRLFLLGSPQWVSPISCSSSRASSDGERHRSRLSHTDCLHEKRVKFDIWDTAGQEQYHSLTSMCYSGGCRWSLWSTWPMWTLLHRPGTGWRSCSSRPAPALSSLWWETRTIWPTSRLCSSRMHKHMLVLLFMETCAKTFMNVKEIFKAFAKKLLKNKQQNTTGTPSRNPGAVP